MAETLGCLCLVLHGHLPFVLNHGSEIHGEPWLYEAAAETYLPLLQWLDELASKGRRAKLTIGLTPVLLEQLRHRRFKEGFVEYLAERRERAARDRAGFIAAGDSDMARLAERWMEFYNQRQRQFESLGSDIVAGFARHWDSGSIEILTSAATHAYLPLLLTDQSISAQLNLGTSITRKHFGRSANGIWLPECAYRPAFDQWKPPVVFDQPRARPGLEQFLSARGLDHFFIDGHMMENGQPMLAKNGNWQAVDPAHLHLDPQRGWRQQLSPVGVVSQMTHPDVFAFSRHPLVSEQVWSAQVGYPGSAEYLDFHRRHGERGLRYHKVTDSHGDLGSKQPYIPDDAATRVSEHAQHFCQVIRRVLTQYRQYTGKPGVITAPFDAELFGHWWFEGVSFLQHVVELLADDPEIRLLTSSEALAQFGCDKAMRLPDASWGKYGNNSTWFNDRTQWIWEVEYRAEARLIEAVAKYLSPSPGTPGEGWGGGGLNPNTETRNPKQIQNRNSETRNSKLETRNFERGKGQGEEEDGGLNPNIETRNSKLETRNTELLTHAARQLLLLQASDWPFQVHGQSSADYAIQRAAGHASNFDAALSAAARLSRGQALTDVQRAEIENMRLHDDIFDEIDQEWWRS